MSNNIINVNQTPFMEIQGKSAINVNRTPYLKVSGFEKEKDKQNIKLDISNEGRLKYESRLRTPDAVSGIGRRGLWGTVRGVRLDPNIGVTFDEIEAMRIDEPETYAKYTELMDKAWGTLKERGIDFRCLDLEAYKEDEKAFGKFHTEAVNMRLDWYNRKCMRDGQVINPADGKYAVLDSLEDIYSSDGQETSFNCYNPEKEDYRSSLWRFHTKFNVLISTDMLTNLLGLGNLNELSDIDKKEKSDLLLKISESVRNIKEAGKQYDGDLKELQFGVKLWDNGNVTYHANYKDCENEDGIMADSTQELLEMLMKKE